jgi:hypothetical protein
MTLTAAPERARTRQNRKQGDAMTRTFAAAIFTVFALTTPAHAAMVVPNAIEAVNITFASGDVLTGEMEWNYGVFDSPGYSFPGAGPTGLYLDGEAAFGGCGAPNGSSLCSLFFSPDTGRGPIGPVNIYAVLAELPNSLTPADFFLNGTITNGFTDGIPGVSGSVSCVDGCPAVSAVPLPSTLPLFGTALAGLGGVGWIKRRRGKVSR